MPKKPTDNAGEIRGDAAYTVREFCRRTGMGYQRVHKHFTSRRLGGRRFILGRDFIEALSREEPPKPER